LVLVCALAPATGSAHDHATGQEIKQYVVYGVYTREQRSQLVREGYDIGEAYWADHVELYGTEEQAHALVLRGYRVEPGVRIDDFPPPDSNYHNYAEMLADMQAVAAAHPSTVRLFEIGQSYEGRVIHAARVSNDATDNLSEPGVFFVGLHHAREHLTVEVVLGLLHHFAESNNPDVQALVQSRQIYIVPNLNPDGGEYDIATGQYRFWRKNRQPNQGSSAIGTDQNRNYSYKWGCCGGSSGNPSSDTYRGPSPFSTPEDTRLRDFVNAHPNIGAAISYHSYGDLVLWPYGYTFQDVPSDMDPIDHDAFVAIGTEMARTTGYTPQQSSDLYITDGDFNDWMYGEKRMFGLTIELSGYGHGFYPPDEFIPGEVQKNRAAAVYVASIADCPTKVVGHPCETDTVEAFPGSTNVKKGRRQSGNAASLAADDGDYFVVRSTNAGVTNWFGTIGSVTNNLSSIKVTYKGKNEPSCQQKVDIRNWTTGTWRTLDTRNVGAETLIADLVPPGSAADYVSGTSGNGDVRVRLRCSSGGTFVASGNLLKIVYEIPA
jgi:hypothetical protein